jgi:hypothetical protein
VQESLSEPIIDEGRRLRDNYKLVFLAMISFSIVFAGLACGDSYDDSIFLYHMDQKMNGNGFFSTYDDTNVANLNISNVAHGSGSYSHESTIEAQNEAKYQRGGDLEDRIIVYDDTWNTWSMIKTNESMDFSYAPINLQLGKYSHPIAFKSKGWKGICLENAASGVSVNTRFDLVEMLHKNITAELLWSWKRIDDELEVTVDNQAKTKLKLKADFSGKGHFGILNINRSIQNPNIMIDEDYSGTYSITKSISHATDYRLKHITDGWLPCCSIGLNEMDYLDQKQFKSAKEFFDCTCYAKPGTAQGNAV